MLHRSIEEKLSDHLTNRRNRALLITGARQVGKTFVIRKVLRDLALPYVEFNFIENEEACHAFQNVSDAKTLLLRLSALTDQKLIPGKTVIFFDEVQVCKEIVTAIKFLVDEGSYSYILSGSLLGVLLKDIRSVPVGYMDELRMYPLSLKEFYAAIGLKNETFEHIKASFENKTPVDPVIHQRLMDAFRLYLVVGGMPAVVQKYLDTNNINEVITEQNSIITAYKRDISKYDPDNKLYIEDIFNIIPAELNCKNKRFILKDLNENLKFNRYSNSFLWLADAGVALPTYIADEPVSPLTLSKATNLFKLFLSDVGLLAAMYMNGIQSKILSGDDNFNFGSVYENAVAQELTAGGYNLFFYNNKKNGEVDFLIENKGVVLPIEVKSGKNYVRHRALANILDVKSYGLKEAYVFCNDNISIDGKVTYLPVYMAMFLHNEVKLEDPIYKLDLSDV
ncbi:MAG: AAA family ATPase [Lachnospiraceae bacterium]|nr:AAA family ATPase [Lachnospiraceae bacterium]